MFLLLTWFSSLLFAVSADQTPDVLRDRDWERDDAEARKDRTARLRRIWGDYVWGLLSGQEPVRQRGRRSWTTGVLDATEKAVLDSLEGLEGPDDSREVHDLARGRALRLMQILDQELPAIQQDFKDPKIRTFPPSPAQQALLSRIAVLRRDLEASEAPPELLTLMDDLTQQAKNAPK